MNIAHLIKFVPPFIAALILGHWLFKEVKKSKAMGHPWHTPYLSPPGIMIFIILIALVGVRILMF